MSTTRSRRSLYTRTISRRPSSGPFNAATAAAWLMEEVLEVDWLCSLSIALISASGAPAKPMRQPVMA